MQGEIFNKSNVLKQRKLDIFVKVNNRNQYYENMKWIKENAVGIFIVFCGIAILIAPFLFTREAALFGIVFNEKTGPIGDTIGGITAPILGFMSIILLYITLKRQVDFNKEQEKFNKKQTEINEEQLKLIKAQDARDLINSDLNTLFKIQDQVDRLVNMITIDGKNKGIHVLISLYKNSKSISYKDYAPLNTILIRIHEACLIFTMKINTSSTDKELNRLFFRDIKHIMFWIKMLLSSILKNKIVIVNKDITLEPIIFNKMIKEEKDCMKEIIRNIDIIESLIPPDI